MPPFPSTEQLHSAVKAAVDIERGIAEGQGLVERLTWLPESELVARVRSHLLGVNGEWTSCIRVCAGGKKPKGGTLHDLEVKIDGRLFAMEAVFCLRAKDGATQYVNPADVDPEVSWLSTVDPAYDSKHVVLFFPPLMPGYVTDGTNAETKNPETHEPIDVPLGTFILSQSLQAPGMSETTKALLSGIIRRVEGRDGVREKWTLVEAMRPNAAGVVVLGAALDPVWAVVASR